MFKLIADFGVLIVGLSAKLSIVDVWSSTSIAQKIKIFVNFLGSCS